LEAAREATQAAKQKDHDRQKALDAALDERRQAELIRSESQRDADAIRAKAKREAAAEHEALMERQAAIEAGLEALLKGEIVKGGEDAERGRTLTFKSDLLPEKKKGLKTTITPAWDWLSRQAERLTAVIEGWNKVRQAQLDARQKSLDEREADLNKRALKQEATKRHLATREEALNSLMQKASEARAAFRAALAPISVWIQEFEVAGGPVRQAMELSPRRKIVEAARAEPAIQSAQTADEDYQNLLAASNAMKKKKKTTGIG